MKKHLFPVLLLCVALMGCNSCGNNGPFIDPPEIDTSDIVPSSVALSNVNIYLDNTESMKGYACVNVSSPYTDVINSIANYYHDKTIQGFYTQSTKTKDPKTKREIKQTQIVQVGFDKMTSELVNKTLVHTDSYQLDDFFKDVEKKTIGGESMSFFITDGIPSGTNEEIKTNPDYSKINASTLQSRITEALRPLGKTAKFGSAIYMFNAPFKGTYYTYKNNKVQLNDVRRPFYVIAVGPSDEIRNFDKAVEKGLNNFKKLSSVTFIRGGSTINLRPTDNEFTAKPTKNDTTYIVMEETSKTVEFFIKKGELPSFTSVENLELEWEGEIIEGDEIEEKNDKFFFDLSLRNYNEDGSYLKIRVKNDLPQWVNYTNSTDDSKIGEKNNAVEQSRTFNLKVLVEGIREGILNDNGSKYQETQVLIRTTDKPQNFEDE